MPNPLHSHESVEHYTPANIIRLARYSLGKIDLDPASDEFGNSYIRADKIYTAEDNGLSLPWDGNVFCNPPGRSDTNSGAAVWWDKAMREFAAHQYMNLIFIGFSLELLQTCQSYLNYHPLRFSYCIPAKRVKFEVNADSRYRQLARQIHDLPLASPRLPRLRAERDRVSAAVMRGDTRVVGNSPTHASVIICASRSCTVNESFRHYFSALGFTGAGDRGRV